MPSSSDARSMSPVAKGSLEEFIARTAPPRRPSTPAPAPALPAAADPATASKPARRKVSKEEDEFEARVCEHGSGLGWMMRAVKRSRTPAIVTVTGWPDLEMLSPRHRVFAVAELKTDLKAHASGDQIQVCSTFAWCGIRAFVWTPDSWDEIDAFLRDPRRFLAPLPATMAYDTPIPSGGSNDGRG